LIIRLQKGWFEWAENQVWFFAEFSEVTLKIPNHNLGGKTNQLKQQLQRIGKFFAAYQNIKKNTNSIKIGVCFGAK